MSATRITKQLVALAVTLSAFALLAAGSAWAGRIALDKSMFAPSPTYLLFSADPGESNRVTVTTPSARVYRIEDRGAPLRAGPGCWRTGDRHVVRCRRIVAKGRLRTVAADLEDRDDRLEYLGRQREFGRLFVERLPGVRAGPGNDVVLGGPDDEFFDGEGGDDLLSGGPGWDVLQGAGDFVRDGDPLGDDRLRGGPGPDILHAGLGDDRVSGGRGNDLLSGDGGLYTAGSLVDPLLLAPGADRMRGGEGIDTALYDFRWDQDPERQPPPLHVSFDGRPNDGRLNERDNFARDVERAYSFTSGTYDWGRNQVVSIRPVGGQTAGRLLIYRFSDVGTAAGDSGLFVGSAFTINEPRTSNAPTVLSLPKSGFETCPRGAGARSSGSGPTHRLRGRTNGGGFRTRGRNSAATVRGTDWTVTDRCDGTLTTVRSGTVRVRDFRLHKTIVLRAGESYLARAAPGR